MQTGQVVLFFKVFLLTLVTCFTSLFASEKLILWTSNEHVQKAVDSVSKGFEKEYGVKVESVVLSKDLTTQFKTAAISGKGPDILTWGHDVVGELASTGLVEPINLSDSKKKEFFPVAIDAFTYEGKVYGYPYDIEAVALFYNKSLVPTPPATMDELMRMAIDIKTKNPKRYGFLYDIRTFFFSFPLLSAQGGYVFKQKSTGLDIADIGLANDGAIAGGNLIKQLIDKKIVPESTDNGISSNLMKKGDLGMTIDGPWAMSDMKKSGVDFGVATLPTFDGKPLRPFVGVHGFMIRRSSKNKELAKEFIENYLVSKGGITALYGVDPRPPSRPDVLQELKEDKNLVKFVESASIGIPMPNVPQMGAVWAAMGGALQNIVGGKQLPKQALTIAKNQIEESLKKK